MKIKNWSLRMLNLRREEEEIRGLKIMRLL